MFVAEF